MRRHGRMIDNPALAHGFLVLFVLFVGLTSAWRVAHFTIVGADGSDGAGELALGLAYLLVLISTQIWLFPSGGRRRPRRAVVPVLGVQLVVTFMPFAHFVWWLGAPGFVMGSFLLLTRARVGVPVALVVMGTVGAFRVANAAPGTVALASIGGVATTLMTGLAVFGLTRLARLVNDLHLAREEAAEVAVAEERLQFARDLHDLLGVRLSAIIARAQRLVGWDRRVSAETTERDLGEVLDISRQALADVRSVARGYRRVPLDVELDNARSALTAAGISLTVDRFDGQPPESVSTVFALTLREAVTNALRFDGVHSCTVTLTRDRQVIGMDVVHDGELDVPPEGHAGSVTELSRQINGLGGTVTSDVMPDGGWRMRVRIPRKNARRSAPDRSSGLLTMSRQLADSVVVTSFLAFASLILSDVALVQEDGQQTIIGTACIAAILAIQVGYFIRAESRDQNFYGVLLLALQAVLVYIPAVQYGGLWLTLPSYIAANALLVFRSAVAVPIGIAVLTSIGWIHATEVSSWLDVLGQVVWALTNVIAVYGVTRLAGLVAELDDTRSELARMAVVAERVRFARDVHDLLGLSLSAVTLKAELANRLLGRDQNKAREQLAEIVELSRKAIGDVRSVASGYREFQLEEELASARSVLASAEIDVRISMVDFEISEPQSSVLATVTREGVTNVLRHSKAEHCEITLRGMEGTVRLEIVNDGLQRTKVPVGGNGGPGGSGLLNLSQRVNELGGDLTVGADADGTYRLCAVLPNSTVTVAG